MMDGKKRRNYSDRDRAIGVRVRTRLLPVFHHSPPFLKKSCMEICRWSPIALLLFPFPSLPRPHPMYIPFPFPLLPSLNPPPSFQLHPFSLLTLLSPFYVPPFPFSSPFPSFPSFLPSLPLLILSLKCYISHEGDSGILGDTLQVLDSLMSSYTEHDRTPPSFGPHLSRPLHKPHPGHAHPPPALQLLHECCHEHQARVGCGVTTLICLTAYWGSEILDLVQQVRGIVGMGWGGGGGYILQVRSGYWLVWWGGGVVGLLELHYS